MRVHSPTAVVLGLLAVLFACHGGDEPSGRATDLPDSIERIEETTESFANAMLDLSVAVKVGNRDVIRDLAAEEVVGVPLPVERAEAEDHGWFSRLTWVLEDSSTLNGDRWLERMELFRAQFSDIEDVRFKVKASEVADDGTTVEGRIAFWLVGRGPDLRREWVKGKAMVSARQLESGWRIERFDVTETGSMIAAVDIFGEVAEPAGLLVVDPPYGASPGPPYAAHGAAVADVNLDGLLDLVTTGPSRNSLYLNRGDGTFDQVGEKAHIAMLPVTVTAPLFLDYDADGDPDLFFSAIGEQVLMENRFIPDGRVEFSDVTFQAKVARQAIGFSAVAGDVDGNGYTDVFVASYNRYGGVMPDRWDGATNGTANLLFLNQGDGTFIEAAEDWGVASNKWSYAAGFADVDGDNDLDLYVANDFGGPNEMFINTGHGFEQKADDFGVADGGYGMGVDFGDYDNDGDLDLHVTRMSSTAGRRILSRLGLSDLPSKERLHMMAVGSALYENVGDGHFRDVSEAAGPFSGGWAWGGGFIDIDNDGHEDIYTPNGFISGSSLKDT